MAPPRYTPIAAEDITSVKCEISHQPTDDMLGKPQHKPFLSKVDLLAVLTSLICFVFSFLVITPKLSWAWRLGLQHQLVLISFFLSVMSQNMKRIMPKILLMLEARWGRSILQNYQAILMNGSLGSHVDNIWRLVLNLLILLPIGLGVAYKQFLNGSSSIKINPNLNGYYGLNFPSLGDFAPMNNSIYLMMNVAAEFMTASSNDLVPFPPFRLPAPFGHNLLLLNNESAAVLDIPMTQYIESMQKEIGTNETWRLSASVNANLDEPDIISFRKSALMFNIRRQKCKGEWDINHSSVKLVGGDCGDNTTYVDSSVVEDRDQLSPFWLDTLPVLVHNIGDFANIRSQSQWLIPSYATDAATAFWVRAAFMKDYAMVEKNYPD
ncbi:hypothetical protein H2198_002587 [Neophaeococcomyces mojaviensis]|uniref:Uncharacterized protein n=1 Tax=Neophaeococcomyces mojaviensis TaxID=3383035 RepID=A0ACC3AE24_9EURO|nr:hypothetical protein H2198_002587 [Knufia sp. JES_112]